MLLDQKYIEVAQNASVHAMHSLVSKPKWYRSMSLISYIECCVLVLVNSRTNENVAKQQKRQMANVKVLHANNLFFSPSIPWQTMHISLHCITSAFSYFASTAFGARLTMDNNGVMLAYAMPRIVPFIVYLVMCSSDMPYALMRIAYR